MINIEQADMITSRLNCSYKDALRALEACDGDVLKAIVFLEEEEEGFFDELDEDDFTIDGILDENGECKYKKAFENTSAKAKEEAIKLFESLKELIKKANANRVVFYKDGKVIADMPITFGALGALFFLPATLVGTGVALVSGCSLKLFKKDGEVIDITNFTKETLEKVKNSLNKKAEDVKEEFEGIKDDIKQEFSEGDQKGQCHEEEHHCGCGCEHEDKELDNRE